MHVEILPPVGKVKYLGQMITFVDQETTYVLGPRSPKSTRTVIPIISISAPTTPVRRSGHTDNYSGARKWATTNEHEKCSRAPLNAECFDSSYKQNENTKTIWNWKRDTRDDEISEETQEEISTNDECDHSSISFDDDEESTTSHEDNLEDWIEHVKRSTREADEKC